MVTTLQTLGFACFASTCSARIRTQVPLCVPLHIPCVRIQHGLCYFRTQRTGIRKHACKGLLCTSRSHLFTRLALALHARHATCAWELRAKQGPRARACVRSIAPHASRAEFAPSTSPRNRVIACEFSTQGQSCETRNSQVQSVERVPWHALQACEALLRTGIRKHASTNKLLCTSGIANSCALLRTTLRDVQSNAKLANSCACFAQPLVLASHASTKQVPKEPLGLLCTRGNQNQI